MTAQQRKGIEILNELKAARKDDGTPVISDDNYFCLLDFIISKPQEVCVPTPYPVIQPWQPMEPYYMPGKVTSHTDQQLNQTDL